MTCIGSGAAGDVGLCHRDDRGGGTVGVTIGFGGGDSVTQHKHVFEVSFSDVLLLSVRKDRLVLDYRGGVGHPQVWAGRRERGTGVPGVPITVAVLSAPNVSVPLVVVAVLVPVRGGDYVSWAGSRERFGVTCFVPGGGVVSWEGSSDDVVVSGVLFVFEVVVVVVVGRLHCAIARRPAL